MLGGMVPGLVIWYWDVLISCYTVCRSCYVVPSTLTTSDGEKGMKR